MHLFSEKKKEKELNGFSCRREGGKLERQSNSWMHKTILHDGNLNEMRGKYRQ